MPTAPVLMLFDGACVFCSRSMQFILRRTDDRLQFCAMQSPPGKSLLRQLGMPLENYETLAVIEDEELLLKSEAVIRLGELMPQPWPMLARLVQRVPRRLRDQGYDIIARHRYRIMGRQNLCALPHNDRRLWT